MIRLWPLGCIAALSVRAYRKKTLTPLGVATAIVVSSLYSIHPWGVFLVMLLSFYITSTFFTKYKHDIKDRLTTKSVDGRKSDPKHVTRTHVQVLANSLAGTILTVLHWHYTRGNYCFSGIPGPRKSPMFFLSDLLVYGIIGHYAAANADTWSSELGILSKSPPFLITTFKPVPPGTNGAVSILGLLSAIAGGATIGLGTAFGLPLCTQQDIILQRIVIIGWSAFMGLVGSMVDSVLGAVLQATPYSKIEKKVVELPGGEQAVASDNITLIGGWDILDNNQVNFAMTFITSFISMALFAWLSWE